MSTNSVSKKVFFGLIRLLLLIIFTSVLIVGCNNGNATQQAIATVPPSAITMALGDHALYLHLLEGWQAYSAENHIILTQQRTNNTGLVVNIWIPQIDLTEESTAVNILAEVAHHMRTTQGIPVSEPNVAIWSAQDAAYYVMDHDGTLSLIMVVMLPNQQMLAVNITGEPMGHAAWTMLAQIFDDFRVNDFVLGGDIFLTLPDQVHSPIEDRPNSTETTPEQP